MGSQCFGGNNRGGVFVLLTAGQSMNNLSLSLRMIPHHTLQDNQVSITLIVLSYFDVRSLKESSVVRVQALHPGGDQRRTPLSNL